eukprot:6205458-Pleurochrysis_carterae.AAC.3
MMRLDSKSAAPEGQDAHDARALADEHLVRRGVRIRRTRGAVEDIDSLQCGVVPECYGGAAGDEGSAGEFHDRTDRALCDPA